MLAMLMRTPATPLLLLALTLLSALAVQATTVKPPKVPAKITIEVDPESVAPGGEASVKLTLDPITGVKINRYPKIKLQVPESEGLVGAAQVAIGNEKPPPAGQKNNYWETVEPVTLTLAVDESASSGEHEIEAKLTYFFCMPASGFCAPKRVPVTIPISVE